jgi:OFA family oxalate/formate antiporter-like MFS transporter
MAKWPAASNARRRCREYARPVSNPQRQILATAAAVLLMSSIGTLYAWSIFVAPIEATFTHSRSATSLVFSVATAAFTLGMLAEPRLARRGSPQAIALFSCAMAAAGLAVAGTAGSIWLVILGFGVLFGLANGFGYSISLQIVQHAVPHRRGLVTGIAVSSYMLGAVIGSPLLAAASTLWGYRAAMLILAGYLAAVGPIAFQLLKESGIATPNAGRSSEIAGAPAPFGDIALLWLLFFLSSLVGVMVLAHAAPLAASFPDGDRNLALAVALVALGNAAGRLAGGWLSDRLRPRTLLCGAPALNALALAAVLWVPTIDVLLMALCAVGAGYGCIAASLPAIVANSYGADRLASLYGRLFTAWGAAGLAAPYLGGVLFDRTGDYAMATTAAAVTSLVAALLGLLYRHSTASRD